MQIYPIRKDREFWRIPINAIHECSPHCETSIQLDHLGSPFISINRTYINGVCSRNNNIQSSSIQLKNFNCSQPRGYNSGRICNLDSIVIPDSEFEMFIYFPLSISRNCKLSKPEPGFTLREVLSLIQSIYEEIYKQEHESSTIYDHIVDKQCECVEQKFELIENETTNMDTCSICYNDYENKSVKLDCTHEFHKNCLEDWIHIGKKSTCPLCRSFIKNCTICNNTFKTQLTISAPVLPIEYNRSLRALSDGIWGISTYYLDNLILDELIYNKILKRLIINITPILF
jgi:hypothetical protein